jgi:hypothetical protein
MSYIGTLSHADRDMLLSCAAYKGRTGDRYMLHRHGDVERDATWNPPQFHNQRATLKNRAAFRQILSVARQVGCLRASDVNRFNSSTLSSIYLLSHLFLLLSSQCSRLVHNQHL